MSTLGTTRSLGTRVVKKIEKPKPLKTSVARHSAPDVPSRFTAVTSAMEEVMSLLNKVVKSIAGRNYLDVQTNASLLTSKLKAYGSQLEETCKDQLDRAFVSFRNACRDEQLDISARKSLLYLVELRAMHWQSSNNLNVYYLRNYQQELEGTGDICMSASSSQITNAPLLLAPGEVLKPSGKFTSPTKMPGKNYCKDEVVIRNADSGKVMGIRGRRVHMIEELSETVISFQRVSPGAKERLVQITGPTEDKIDYAKHLMEDTIKRNASPVREVMEKEHAGGSNSSLNSSTSDESNRLINTGQIKSKKLPINDIGLFDYKHTVNVNEDTLHIASFNLDLVREAKIILDEYFNGGRECLKQEARLPRDFFGELSPKAIESFDVSTAVSAGTSPTRQLAAEITVQRGHGFETENTVGDFTTLDHEIEHQEPNNEPVSNQPVPVTSLLSSVSRLRPKYEYSRQFLLDCSESYKSHQPPKRWEEIAKKYPAIIKQVAPSAKGIATDSNQIIVI